MGKTPESAEVLGENKTGWFGATGKQDIMEVANAPLKTSYKFEDMFICDPSKKHYGYKSWDGEYTPFLPVPRTNIAQHSRRQTSSPAASTTPPAPSPLQKTTT